MFYVVVEIDNKADMRVDINGTIRLECRSRHWLYKPAANVESRKLSVDGGRIMFEMTADHEGVVFILTIHHLVISDSGIYTCVHANRLQQYEVTVLSSSGMKFNQPLYLHDAMPAHY